MGRGTRRGRLGLPLALGLAAALVVPAGASAATKPVVRTGGSSDITQSTAAVHGTVNPEGAVTTYFFQYGLARGRYTAQTAPASAGGGTRTVGAAGAISLLAPATTYHYRVRATNAKGTSVGADRTFKTKPQPLGVSLAGNPNPVLTGGSTTLAGTLSGTGNANRQVVLQSNPFPYTQGFLNVSNPQVTDASGNFAFPVLSVPVNTQFRVLMPQKPEVQSPIVLLGTTVRVTTHRKVRRFAHGARVRLAGSILPPADGTQVLIQRLVNGSWKNIASTNARHVNGSRSAYSKAFHQRRPGTFRVLVNASGEHVPSAGRTVRIAHMHR